jgi:Glycosyl hydrolases family 16
MMKARTTPEASIEKTPKGYLMKIPAGDSSSYRFAQIDDYFGLPRGKFPHHSLTLSLRARTSSLSLPGTWGFGLWNDPFGMSLGFGANRFRLPTLPNAAWFFGASQENYLSFRSGFDTGGKNARPTQPPLPGNGFLAQSFRSPKFHASLIPAGLVLPFSPKTTRRMLSKVIAEDSSALRVDVTQWHSYKLEWSEKRVVWYVDEVPVFESPVSPNPPLGVVIWIDNQYAAFTPEGKISFGVLEGNEEWLEIEDLIMSDE